jgi:enoyl-CoA hydratase/carnithine racemase
MCVNGEPVDGHEAVAIGLADEFCPSSIALDRAVRLAQDVLSGRKTLARRDWDTTADGQKEALDRLFAAPGVKEILSAPPPDADGARNLRPARLAAGKAALLAMKYGYSNGFAAGLENDARAFGEAAASPAGQEWVRRFLDKDPRQSSFLTLLPPQEAP